MLSNTAINVIPFNQLAESPLNPRRTFDAEAIAELAESIVAQGVLQNLVVRTAKKGKGYEIIAGARRYRAVKMLVDADRASADLEIPAHVHDCDDLGFLRLATTENVQREDIHPLEEAEAYAALIKAGDTTENIAKMVGKTRRHVQLRLALVDKLANGAKKAFRDGTISLAQARALAMAGTEQQLEAVGQIKEGYILGVEHLKNMLTRDMHPVSWALFDHEIYKGDIYEDPDDPKERYFADVAQSEKLQRAAIDKMKAELEAEFAWVEVFTNSKSQYFHDWKYKTSKDKKKAGAAVEINWDLSVDVHKNIVRKEEKKTAAAQATGKAGTPKSKEPADTITQAHLEYCHNRKTEMLQTAIAGNPPAALRLACLALMGGQKCVHIEPEAHDGMDEIVAPAVTAALDRVRARFKKNLCKQDYCHGATKYPLALAHGYNAPDSVGARAWEVLAAMSDKDVKDLLAALVAARCGTFNGYRSPLGDNPAAVAIAGDLAVKVEESWTIDADFLATCRKPQLLGIGAAIALVTDHNRAAFEKKTMPRIREKILAHLEAHPEQKARVPATMRFATTAKTRRAVNAEAKAPAGAKA